MGCIDLHAWASRVDRPDRPDWVMFDLDPSPDVGFRGGDRGGVARPRDADAARPRLFREDVRITRDPRARPDRPATHVRGGPGVRRRRRGRGGPRPSRPGDDRVDEVEATRRARRREPERPGSDERAVYSVRPRAGAPVSTPLRWDELTRGSTRSRSRWTWCSIGLRVTATCSRARSPASSR